jgi:hypothetical protein
MIPYRGGIRSGAGIILSAVVIFAVLKHGPTAVDTPWGLLVAFAAALGLRVLGLCSAMSLGAPRHDDEGQRDVAMTGQLHEPDHQRGCRARSDSNPRVS